MRTEMGYGFFHGGDPRKFWPDGECCSAEEIENHKASCAFWNEAEARGETPEPEACPSGYLFDAEGKCVGHVLRAPYGIGTYEIEWDDEEGEAEEDDEADCGMMPDGDGYCCTLIGSEQCEMCPNRQHLGEVNDQAIPRHE